MIGSETKLGLTPQELLSVQNFNPAERRATVIADSPHGLEALRATAEQNGVRVLATHDLKGGALRLAEGFAGDAILLDVAQDGGEALDRVLDQVDALAWQSSVAVVANVAGDALDVVAARLSAPSVALLCNAGAADWVSAMALSGRAMQPVLRETGDDESIRVQRLADEVARIAKALAELANGAAPPLGGFSDAQIGYRAEPSAVQRARPAGHVVRAIIRSRRLRDRYFPADIFADPAWDMLLDLMAARLEGLRVAVSSLCIAAAVPPTTALRWIKTMTDSGIFLRIADVHDGRRVFIELSDQAANGMLAWLEAAKTEGVLAG